MKSWLTICIFITAASLCVSRANSDEPRKTATHVADSTIDNRPGEVRDDNGLKMKLVWCPPGKFTMGSPKSEIERSQIEDQVDVTLTTGYWFGQFEVTQNEWKRVMGTEPWHERGLGKVGRDFPATFVSWNDAGGFCRRLTEQERKAGRLSKDWEYILPTEAQWEYACRAGTETKFSFGDDESQLGDFAWFFDNAGKTSEYYPHRVGQKKPNPWGLFDMHGNAYEWCKDLAYVQLPGGLDPEVKPDAQTVSSNRVCRGGSWYYVASTCRSAYRHSGAPDSRGPTVGFRVALCSTRHAKGGASKAEGPVAIDAK